MALTVEEFLKKWEKGWEQILYNDVGKREKMKADLEEMMRGPDSLWRREYDCHWASRKGDAERLERAKAYAKAFWDDNFMGTTREQCDKAFEESWRREVVLIPSESILAKEDGIK